MRKTSRYWIALACLAGMASAERYPNQRNERVLENGDPEKSGYCWARFAGNALGSYDTANVALATRITPQLLGVSTIVNDVYAGGTASRDRASIVKAAAGLGGIVVYKKEVVHKRGDKVRKVSLTASLNSAKTLHIQNRDFTIGAVRVELRANAVGEAKFSVALAAQSTVGKAGPDRADSGNMSLKGYCVSGMRIAYECRGGGQVIGPASGGDQRVRGTISTPTPYNSGYSPLYASFNWYKGGGLSGTTMHANWDAYAANSVDLSVLQPDKKRLTSRVLDANGWREDGRMRFVE